MSETGQTVLLQATISTPETIQVVRDDTGAICVVSIKGSTETTLLPPVSPADARALASAVLLREKAALTGPRSLLILAAFHMALTMPTGGEPT